MRVWTIVSVACVVSVLFYPWQAQAVVVWNDWTAGNEVCFIREQGGQLLVGTEGAGLVVWDLATRRYEKFDERDGLPYPWVTCAVLDSDGSIWAGCCIGGVVRIKDGVVQEHLLRNLFDEVTDIELDPEGRLWIGTYANGLFRYQGGQLRHFEFGGASRNVPSITVDCDGTVWVAAPSVGLVAFRDGDWAAYAPREYPSLTFTDVEAAPSGGVWVLALASEESFIYFFRGDWQSFAVPTSRCVLDIAVDSEGNVWAVDCQRLFEFDGHAWRSWGEIDDIDFRDGGCISVSADGSTLWVGRRNNGVVRVSGRDASEWLTDDPVTEGFGLEMAAEGERIWVAMDHTRLATYFHGQWEVIQLIEGDAPDAQVRGMAVGPDGTKWVCYASLGLAAYDGQGVRFYGPGNSPLSPSLGPVIVDRQGVVWVWDSSYGLWAFDGTSWLLFLPEERFPLRDVLVVDQGPDGRLWFGGDPGACVFDGASFTHYSSANSPLPEWPGYVYAMVCAPDGKVYFNVRNGIACLDGDEWTVYTSENSELPRNAGCVLDACSDGVLWLHGLYMWDGKGFTGFTPQDSPLVALGVGSALCVSDGVWLYTNGGLSYRHSVPGEIKADLSLRSAPGTGSDSGRLGVGEQLVVAASCENPIGDVWADVYLWVECPDGNCYFLPSLSQEPERLARKVHFPDGLRLHDVPIFTCDASSVPPGRYTFGLIIMNRNSKTEPLSNIASCEWEFEK